MVASKKEDVVEAKRVEVDEAVDDSLDVDDVWNDLITDNAVPPLKVKGIVLRQPTKKQVEAWRSNSDSIAGEKILFGAETYDKLQDLFANLPQSAWTNFNNLYLKHMFGFDMGQVDSLKG